MAILITGGARSGKSDFAERYAMQLSAGGVYVATSQSRDDEMAERIARHRLARENSGFAWRTVEEPFALAEVLRRLEREAAESGGRQRPAVLVDCLTLWLTNWMLRLDSSEHPENAGEERDSLDPPQGDGNGKALENDDELSLPGSGRPSSPDTPKVARLKKAGIHEPADLGAVMDELLEAVTAFSGPLLLVTNEVGSGIVPAYPLGRRFRDEAGRLNRMLAAVSEMAFLVVAGFALDLKAHAFRLEE